MIYTLIKTDDFSLKDDMRNWERFFNLCKEHKVYADVGIMSLPGQDREILREWLKKYVNPYISFFRHGHKHDRYEFNSNSARYMDSIDKSQEFELDIFNRELGGFGAPWNQMSEDFITYYRNKYPDNYLYYADMDPDTTTLKNDFNYAKNRNIVSFKYHISFELKDKHYDPDFEYFRKVSKQKIIDRQPLVLQIHPPRWTDRAFGELTKIIEYLKNNDASFVAVQDFIQKTHPAKLELTQENIGNHNHYGGSNMISAAMANQLILRHKDEIDNLLNKTISFYKLSYDSEHISKISDTIDRMLSAMGRPANVETILDIGCGVGSWLFLLNSQYPESLKLGMDPHKDAAPIGTKILDLLGVKNFKLIQHATQADLQLNNAVSMSICYGALNFFNIFDYLIMLFLNSSIGSKHYLGYRNWNSYLYTLNKWILSNNIRGVIGRLHIILSSLQFKFGYYKQSINETCIPTDDIMEILRLFNFNISDFYYDDNTNRVSCYILNFCDNTTININQKIRHIGLNNSLYKILNDLKYVFQNRNVNVNFDKLSILECPEEVNEIFDQIEREEYDKAFDIVSESNLLSIMDKYLFKIVITGLNKEYRKVCEIIKNIYSIYINPADPIRQETTSLLSPDFSPKRNIGATFDHISTARANQLIEPHKNEINHLLNNVIAFYKVQYDSDNITTISERINRILTAMGRPANVETILDIGSGVGSWLFLLNSIYPASAKIGIESDKDAAAICDKILNLLDVKNFRIINAPVQANLSINETVSLSFCNRSLNYFNIIDYLILLFLNSSVNSRHYIGYQNWNFYLHTLDKYIKTNNIRGITGRINIILSSLQFKFGYFKQRNNEICIDSDDIIEILKIFNLNIQDCYYEDNSNDILCYILNFYNNTNININKKINNIGVHNNLYKFINEYKYKFKDKNINIDFEKLSILECPKEINEIFDLIETEEFKNAFELLSKSNILSIFDKNLFRIVIAGLRKDYKEVSEIIKNIYSISKNPADPVREEAASILPPGFMPKNDVMDGFDNALALYKKSKFFYDRSDLDAARKYEILNRIYNGCVVPPTCVIGENTTFSFGGQGVAIHPKSQIGECCTIGNQVMLGDAARVADFVYIGSGAKILKNVGKFCVIGANAVITHEVEPFSVMGGNPARIIATITPENIDTYIDKYFLSGKNHHSISKDAILKEFKKQYNSYSS